MTSTSFSSQIWYIFLFTSMLGCFSGCGGNHERHPKTAGKLQVANDKKMSEVNLFLTYIDTVAKLSLKNFNEAGIQSVNKKFSNQLPLVMYNPSSEENGQNIVIQPYENKETANKIRSGAIFLVPKHLTDSLYIADFTAYFGSLKKEKPMIGITAQPLPVQIAVSASTAIKLTFNDHEKIGKAKVIMVEVLKYN